MGKTPTRDDRASYLISSKASRKQAQGSNRKKGKSGKGKGKKGKR